MSVLSMEGSINKMRHGLRKEEESRILQRRQNILYLIYDYLNENNYTDTCETLISEAELVSEIQVCDNIDLERIIMEFESYYHMKFNKYPMFCKKNTTNIDKKKSKTKVTMPATKQSQSELMKENSIQQEINNEINNINLAMTVKPIFPNENIVKVSSEEFDIPKEKFMQSKIWKCIEKLYSANSELRKIAIDISHEIVLENLNVHWDDVVGLDDCKTAIKEAIVYPLKYPVFFAGPFSPWKGILLYGPPGTGKTMLVKAVATECKCTFFNITASSLVSKWRGDSEKYIRVLFDLAYSHSPTIIFIDEIDWIATNVQNNSLSEPAKRFRSELLTKLDGLVSTDNSNVLLLAATNSPWNIDSALLRRLEKRIYVSLPNEATRLGIFKLYLSDNLLKNKNIVDFLMNYTKQYSGADIKLLCKQAWMLEVTPMWKNLEKKEIFITDLKYELRNIEILKELLKETVPTVTNTNIYDNWDTNINNK
ncbi:katanin p60 ATPase-containing subunit A-like 2 [Apis florea]|uniref:katanin p60 ATPase-containing subunit A-like 2 n=1 Tax=Apis florea TaxID=7463 RepID=UPI0006293535|nr:katanin p60 ATPase-containing subunit A-like 2 [Apis florea]